MTDYDKIEAGDELNALVAERIFGWKHLEDPQTGLTFFMSPSSFNNEYIKSQNLREVATGNECTAPHYSTSWAAAGEVVEKLRERYPVTIEVDKNGYHCEIWSDFVHSSHYRQIAEATAGTFQLAVSRIALKVADSQDGEGEG